MKPRLIGLTGNIGCGKSTVANLFAKLPNVAVYDVDKVWKELIGGSVCRMYIEGVIGPESFKDNQPQFGFIASVIFADEEKRHALETFAKLHVMTEILYRVQKSSATIHIVESAMLFETGAYKDFSEVIAVDCDKKEQMRRVLSREIPGRACLTREQFEERVVVQWPQEKKVALATYTIHTFCSLSELEVRVRNLYNLLCTMRS